MRGVGKIKGAASLPNDPRTASWSTYGQTGEWRSNFYAKEVENQKLLNLWEVEYSMKKRQREIKNGKNRSITLSDCQLLLNFIKCHNQCTQKRWKHISICNFAFVCVHVFLLVRETPFWNLLFPFPQDGENGRWHFFRCSAVAKWFDFFNFSQLFWRDFDRGIPKMFSLWS